MASLTTTPVFSAGNWLTQNVADIRLVMKQVLDIHEDACPTLQILMANAEYQELGPRREMHSKIRHKMYNVHASPGENIRFDARDLDPMTQATWTAKRWYTSAGTNYEEMLLYGRGNRSRIDLINEKALAMRSGMAWKMNYSIFSDWAETITAGEINLETELASNPVPPAIKIEDLTSHTDRIYSMPMLARSHSNGHTIGNLASTNAFWATSATNGVGTDANRSAAGDNIDVVDNGTTMAVLEDLTIARIREHLNKMVRGPGTELLCAMPADLYDVLEDYLLSERRRAANDADTDTPIMDLGINAVIRMISRNCTFYVDPMMTDLWPNSLYYWSLNSMRLVLDPGMAPWVVDWERIPGGNQYATGMVYLGNIIIPDGGSRRNLSEMHGWQAP